MWKMEKNEGGLDSEDLTWDAVSRASGVDEPIYNLRGKSSTSRASNSRL